MQNEQPKVGHACGQSVGATTPHVATLGPRGTLWWHAQQPPPAWLTATCARGRGSGNGENDMGRTQDRRCSTRQWAGKMQTSATGFQHAALPHSPPRAAASARPGGLTWTESQGACCCRSSTGTAGTQDARQGCARLAGGAGKRGQERGEVKAQSQCCLTGQRAGRRCTHAVESTLGTWLVTAGQQGCTPTLGGLRCRQPPTVPVMCS